MKVYAPAKVAGENYSLSNEFRGDWLRVVQDVVLGRDSRDKQPREG
jgi:hypothetical protein